MSVLLEYQCPRCGKRNDDADAVGPDGERVRPKAGDIAVCIGCAAPLRFRVAMPPAWMTYEECQALDREDRGRLTQAIMAIVTMQPSTLRRTE